MPLLFERENLRRCVDESLIIGRLYEFQRPACTRPLNSFPLSIVRIFSVVNIYVIYGEFNDAYCGFIPTLIPSYNEFAMRASR